MLASEFVSESDLYLRKSVCMFQHTEGNQIQSFKPSVMRTTSIYCAFTTVIWYMIILESEINSSLSTRFLAIKSLTQQYLHAPSSLYSPSSSKDTMPHASHTVWPELARLTPCLVLQGANQSIQPQRVRVSQESQIWRFKSYSNSQVMKRLADR